MYDCKTCQYIQCTCRRVMFYQDYLREDSIPMIFNDYILRDIIDALDYIISKEKNIEVRLGYNDVEQFAEIVLEQYINNDKVEFCYYELAILLSRKYGEMVKKEIPFRCTTYGSMDTFFIYVLRFLYGSPDSKNNYLKEELGFDNETLERYVKWQDDLWKAKKIKRNFIKVLKQYANTINPSQQFDEIDAKYKQVNSLRRNSYIQQEQKKYWMKVYGKCMICGKDIQDILILSHSKPCFKCSETERKNQYNTLLLCPDHDALYDKGLITIDDDGKIICDRLSEENKEKLLLKKYNKCYVDSRMWEFLKWHRENEYNKIVVL